MLKEVCKRGHLLKDTRIPSSCGTRCGKCRKEYNREFLKKHRSRWIQQQFISRLKRVYSLTWEQYQGYLAIQENKCAICKVEFTGTDSVNIDHAHTSNKVRGFLCRNCNVSLGLFKDSVESLSNAIKYLVKSHV